MIDPLTAQADQLPRQPLTGRPLLLVLISVLCCWMLATSTVGDDSNPAASSPPGSYRITSEDGIVRFPFDLFRGDIRFKGEINGHEVHMLLDDGYMWDQLLFWGSPRIDSLGLTYDGETNIGGSTDEGGFASRTASGITISFPGVEFADQTAIVTPFSSGNSSMWWGSEGQVSCTFLKHFVVDINFDSMMITLIEPEDFDYAGRGVEIPWQPLGFGPWAIPGTLALADGREVSLDLMMDLGYNDQLYMNTTGEHGITTPEQAIPASLGVNIQGQETLGDLGRVPGVVIGGYAVRDILSAFVSEEHSDHTHAEVMIGLGLLSRFNLVFDYTRQRLFIEPNHTFDDSYEHNMTGLTLRRGDAGAYRVTRVHPGSPASEVGLQVGDRITLIDGKPAAEYDIWTLRPLLERKGATVALQVERRERTMEVSLTLKRVI